VTSSPEKRGRATGFISVKTDVRIPSRKRRTAGRSMLFTRGKMKELARKSEILLASLVAALLVLASCGRGSREAKPVTGTNESGNRSVKLGKFGGGYKQTKWGMSPEQVKEAMGLTASSIANEDASSIDASCKEGGDVSYDFRDGKLQEVVYSPGLNDGNKEGVLAMIQILEEKYGTPDLGQGVNGLGYPVDIRKWSDGETDIIFTVWQENPELYSAGDDIGAQVDPGHYYPSSTVIVHYRSTKLYVDKDDAASREKVQREKEALKSRF
jgi:hypothetical protein